MQNIKEHARATGEKVNMAGYKKGGLKKNKGGAVKKKKAYRHGGRVSGGMKNK